MWSYNKKDFIDYKKGDIIEIFQIVTVDRE